MTQFPKDFLWGAATSAYQVEGQNPHCDWWEWEKRIGLKDLSGLSCRHYELFKEDFALASQLKHNAHRLSIEWSRIEPEEGKFDANEVNHYSRVLSCLKELHLEPIVTLHHFTNPIWFSRKGGWLSPSAVEDFLRYVRFITQALGPQVNFWMTINEPQVYLYHGFVSGAWPPQEKSLFKANQAQENLINAHIKAYRAINEI
ncbi:MAG: family 1 glycosylhydrolase, partial [Candidatus Omnitrophica bacterium]|nr:family 1 glycosylhydrolase [Candidatus Omnitrophota bacterium]